MATISFLNLEVQKGSGNEYTLAMSFKIGQITQPNYLGQKTIKLMYKIYDGNTCPPVTDPSSAECKGTLIDYSPQGFVSIPTTFNKSIDDQYYSSTKRSRITDTIFTDFNTDSNNILVQVYLVGAGQPRYVTGTATGNTEYEQFSNITEQTLTLTGIVHGTGFDRTRGQQAPVTEEVTVDAPQEITLDSIVSGITQAVTVQEAAAETQVLGHTPPPPPPAPTLSQETRKIIDDWSTKKIIVPNWFANNNINWVLQGKISEEEFIAGYTNLLNTGVIIIPTTPTPPTPTPPPIDTSTSLTMISQKWDYFDIVDGRAKGQITFRATSDFNPYYYGKELVNYMQLVNNQGLTIVLKPNVLRFTQTETDETIQYDEGVGDLKSLKVESYVWTHDNQPMSSLYKFPIYDGKPPGTGTGELARTDFLAKIGGVLAGSIAIALLLPKRIGN